MLAVEPEAVDAVRFQRLAEQGRKALSEGSAEEASDLLAAALVVAAALGVDTALKQDARGLDLTDLVDPPF